jgi:hypothetical protein
MPSVLEIQSRWKLKEETNQLELTIHNLWRKVRPPGVDVQKAIPGSSIDHLTPDLCCRLGNVDDGEIDDAIAFDMTS